MACNKMQGSDQMEKRIKLHNQTLEWLSGKIYPFNLCSWARLSLTGVLFSLLFSFSQPMLQGSVNEILQTINGAIKANNTAEVFIYNVIFLRVQMDPSKQEEGKSRVKGITLLPNLMIGSRGVTWGRFRPGQHPWTQAGHFDPFLHAFSCLQCSSELQP